MRAIVKIWHGVPNKGGTYAGSGFFINGEYFLTASHVLKDRNNQYIPPENLYLQGAWPDGRSVEKIRAYYPHQHSDFAIVQAAKGDADCHIRLNLAPNRLVQGQTVKLCGYSSPDGGSVDIMETTLRAREGAYDWEIVHTENAPGMSGGPALDETGLAIGVVLARHRDDNKTAFLPLYSVQEFIASQVNRPAAKPKGAAGDKKHEGVLDLADRDKQARAFKKALQAYLEDLKQNYPQANRPKPPFICIAHGQDCEHDRFINRLSEHLLPEHSKRELRPPQRLSLHLSGAPVSGPEELRDLLSEALEHPGYNLHRRLPAETGKTLRAYTKTQCLVRRKRRFYLGFRFRGHHRKPA